MQETNVLTNTIMRDKVRVDVRLSVFALVRVRACMCVSKNVRKRGREFKNERELKEISDLT